MTTVVSKTPESQLHAEGGDVKILKRAVKRITPSLHVLRGFQVLGESADFRGLQSTSLLNEKLSEARHALVLPVLNQVFNQQDVPHTRLRVWFTRDGRWLVWSGRLAGKEGGDTSGEVLSDEDFKTFGSVTKLCKHLRERVADEAYVRGDASYTRPRYLPLLLEHNLSVLVGQTIEKRQAEVDQLKRVFDDNKSRVDTVELGV